MRLEYDLDLLDADWGLKKILMNHGLSGFIERFLLIGLYVFHSISMSIQEKVRSHLPYDKASLDLMSVIRKLSQAGSDLRCKWHKPGLLVLGILGPELEKAPH